MALQIVYFTNSMSAKTYDDFRALEEGGIAIRKATAPRAPVISVNYRQKSIRPVLSDKLLKYVITN